jgi:hypothetical protein
MPAETWAPPWVPAVMRLPARLADLVARAQRKPAHFALLVFAATVISLVGFGVVEQQRADTEIRSIVAARRAELGNLVTGQVQSLEQQGQNAWSDPRVIAALNGNLTPEALSELFRTESWWQPFRESFVATYMAPAPAGKPIFMTGKNDAALERASDLWGLAERARQSRTVTSSLLAVPGWAYVVVAIPILMPMGPSPVLLLSQPIDGAKLSMIADRTGEAVLLSDGQQVLVGAGPAAEMAVVKQVIGHEADPTLPASMSRGAAVAVAGVAPGIFLLSHVGTSAAIADATSGLGMVRAVIGFLGGTLLLLIALPLVRRRWPRTFVSTAPNAAPAEPPFAATVTDAGSGSRYVLLQRIGGGGMAEVHLAVSVGERGFRRPCVVKRLRPELAEDAKAVAQFTDEATLASSLVHANIVPIFDFARVGSNYLLVEEYIVGRDLGRVIRRARAVGKPLSPDLVAYVAVEALKAFAYAHSKRDHDGVPLGIVHRDVSPENLMVTTRGEVQLLDFGVVKVDEARGRRTDIGELKGNIMYVSPEQARGLEVDARADLFSLGLVIYFALTGETLYGTDTGYDLLVRAASGPGPAEIAKLAQLPEPFAKVLTRALAARPELRFPNAAAFAEALAPYAAEGSARLGKLVADLFGDELAEEQQNLSAGATRLGAGPGAGTNPGTGSQPGARLTAGSTPIASHVPAALRSN